MISLIKLDKEEVVQTDSTIQPNPPERVSEQLAVEPTQPPSQNTKSQSHSRQSNVPSYNFKLRLGNTFFKLGLE